MLFQTFDFLLFAIPVLVGFWALSERPVARVLFLLVASYFFYMAGPKTEPPPAPAYFVGLLWLSTVLDFVCGRRIFALGDAAERDDAAGRGARRRRNAWLALSLIGNLGMLAYFKYANFLIEAFTDVGSLFGLDLRPFRLDVVLPLGISFYTFQSLSYTLDIWRGRLTPEPSLGRFALFVAFFPQLVAGPIVRAKEFLPQLRAGPRFTRLDLESGAFRVVKGLTKKVVLGDFIAAQLTDRIFDAPQTFTSPELMVALYAYTLQIYADFSGYSDIAIGLGRMLGFQLPENFDRPYQSRDIAEYWRRWHITLSTWLRDYLFFNLLARLGARGGYVAMWTTMFLVGMWHGASWNFVIYANIHALAMVFNRWHRMRRGPFSWGKTLARWSLGLGVGIGVGGWVARAILQLTWAQAFSLAGFGGLVVVIVCALPSGPKVGRLVNAVHVVLTFHLVVLARIFFRAPDLQTAREFCGTLLSWDGHWIREGLVGGWVWAALVFGLAYHFTPARWVEQTGLRLFRGLPDAARFGSWVHAVWGLVLGLGFTALIYGFWKLLEGVPRAFIYFAF